MSKINKRIKKIIKPSQQMKKQTRLESIIKVKKKKVNQRLEETNLNTLNFKEVQNKANNKKEIKLRIQQSGQEMVILL